MVALRRREVKHNLCRATYVFPITIHVDSTAVSKFEGTLYSSLSRPLASYALTVMHPELTAASVVASLSPRLPPPHILYRAHRLRTGDISDNLAQDYLHVRIAFPRPFRGSLIPQNVHLQLSGKGDV